MAVSYVSSAGEENTSITSMPSHQAGDLLLCAAWRDGDTTIPSLPAGWVSLAATSSSPMAVRLGAKIAQSAAETSGTWANATALALGVWRGTDRFKSVFGSSHEPATVAAVNSSSVTSRSIFGGLTFADTGGSSWWVAFCADDQTDGNLTVNSGSQRLNFQGASMDAVIYDSNGGAAAWPAASLTMNYSGSAGKMYCLKVEIQVAEESTTGFLL